MQILFIMSKNNHKEILRILILCLLLLASLFSFNSNARTNDSFTPDSRTITKLKKQDKSNQNNFIISVFTEIPTYSFLISTDVGRVDKKEVKQRVQYGPTFGPNLGLAINYKGLDFSLSKRISSSDSDKIEKYGKTDYIDFRTRYKLFESVDIEAYYQKYKGLFTDLNGQEGLQTSFGDSNSSSGISNEESMIISRPDISAVNFGLRAIRTVRLNPLFSFFNPSAKNESSSWDLNFLTKAYYNRLIVSGDEPLVPAANSDSFSPIASLKEVWTHSLGLGAGLGVHVPTSKKFSMGFNTLIGFGLQRQATVFSDREETSYNTDSQEVNTNLYVDWKSLKHGFHFGIYWDHISSKIDDVNFDSSNLGASLRYSYRGLSL